jgi:hypothetical protein
MERCKTCKWWQIKDNGSPQASEITSSKVLMANFTHASPTYSIKHMRRWRIYEQVLETF